MSKESFEEEEVEYSEIGTFTIEADHPRNCDLLIQSIPGLRLRSAIEGTRPVTDQQTGEPMVPADQSRALAALPRIPGMQIRVQPELGLVIVADPLTENSTLCTRLATFLKNHTPHHAEKVEGVEKQKYRLDEHQMKTLCRELVNIVNAKEGTVVEGKKPTLEKVDNMKGRYLMNSGHTSFITQPRYEDQMNEWLEQLSRIG